METKRIITLGRETGSGGHKIGEMLAEKLGVKCYDKELLDRAAKESGLCRELLESNDEKPTNSFLYSLVMDTYSLGYSSSPYVDMPINQKIFLAQFDSIRNLAQQESCVIVGRCADYALDGMQGVLSVFISAEEEDKITRVQAYQGGNISRDKAREIMLKTDKRRSSYYNYYSNKRWGDSRSYDLCINSSKFGLEGAVEMILESLKKEEEFGMAADEKTEREQYLKELARLKSLRSKQNDEKKDAADTAASLPVSGKDTKNPERTAGTRQESNLTLQRLRDAALAESPTKEAETPLQRMRDAAAKESAKREADSTFERLKAEALLQKQAERVARTEEKASMEVVADPEEEGVETDSEDALSKMQHRAESLLAGFRKPKRETEDELPEAEADEPEGQDVMAKSATRSSRNKNSRDSNAARRKTAKPAAGAGEKKKKGKKSPILIFIALLSCFLVVWGAKNLLLGQKTHASGYYTVAVFGVDSRNGNLGKDALSDVNMLVSLNKETGDIRICSIYRDTFMQIDKSGKHHKFNEAYFKGGPEQALWMIRYNLDIQPDDYITFNWKAVVDAVNIMGGVDIEITPAEFKYINSFITETVKSTGIGSVQLTHPGMNHLDGVQAVAYARLRLMDTDYNRTERQRKVVSLLMDKIRAADTAKRIELVTSVLPETKTSMGLDDVLAYAKDIKKYHIAETSGFPFERDAIWIEKKDCVVPITLESNVISLHQFLFQEENYQPSASVREVSDYIVKKTGLKGKGKSAEIQTDKPGAVGNTGEVKEKNKKSSTTEQAAEEKGSKSSSAAAESSAAETSSAASTEAETTVATTESTKKKHSEAASKTSESIEESSAGKVKPKSSEKDNESVVGPGASIRETKESATSAAETEVVGPGAGLPAN